MPFPQCSQLTADSGHNSYFQQCKCSVLTRCIEEGEGVKNWRPLKQAHWPNRFQRGQSSNTPLKQAHCVEHAHQRGRLWRRHCDGLCSNLVRVLVLSLFWGGRGSGSGSVGTELRVLVLGQTLNHWVVCSGWALNRWVVRSGVVHSGVVRSGVVRSVSRVLTRLIRSVSHDSLRLVCLSSGFLVAAI